MNLGDKVALVTGAARGIGKATALALARAGADVIVNYVQNRAAARDVAERIQGLGRRAIAIKANVGNPSEVKALFEQSDNSLGAPDILINNAAIGILTSLEDITVDFWNHILQVDLTGPFLCTQAAASRMISKKYGRIVNVSSIGGILGMDKDPAYASAKAGLLGFTKSMARYLGRHNITVNSVAPGPTDTELSKKLPHEIREGMAEASALGRIGKPEDIADAILFFASDYSRHVTGQTILVDGGISMP